MEHRLGQVGSVVMGFLEGRMEGLSEEMSEEALGSGGLDASGDNSGGLVGDAVNVVAGALTEVVRKIGRAHV